MRSKAGLLPTLGPEVSSDISIVDSGTFWYQSKGNAAGTTEGSFKEARPGRQPRRSARRPSSPPPSPHFHFVPSSSSPFLLIFLLWRHVFAPFILAKVAALPHSLIRRRKFEVDTKLLRGRTRTATTIRRRRRRRRRGPPTSRIMLFTAAESSSVDGRGPLCAPQV